MQQVMPLLAKTDTQAQHLCRVIFQGFKPGSVWGEFDRGRLSPAQVAVGLAAQVDVAHAGVTESDILALLDAVPEHLYIKADTLELMLNLQMQGHRLVYLSNMPAPFAAYLLQTHDVFKHFEGGVFSADVGWIKPEPQIYALAEERLNLSPREHETLFIDDNAHNIEAAKARGWAGLVFVDALQCQQGLTDLGWLRPPPHAA